MKPLKQEVAEARAYYIPSDGRRVRRVAARDCQAEAYIFRSVRGEPSVKIFIGQAKKPNAFYYFANVKARKRVIREWFERQMAREARNREHRAKRAAPHSFKAGDILVCSWGYEQTNIDFYQVTRISKACVWLREIASEAVSGNAAYMTQNNMPCPDKFTGEEFRRTAGGETGWVRLNSYSGAMLWDGDPVQSTHYA